MNCKVFMCATIKATAAFNVVGLPSKRVCARRLINNNNSVKKHSIFCVPGQPLLDVLGCRVLDKQWDEMKRKKEKVFQCCFKIQNHTALCILGEDLWCQSLRNLSLGMGMCHVLINHLEVGMATGLGWDIGSCHEKLPAASSAFQKVVLWSGSGSSFWKPI